MKKFLLLFISLLSINVLGQENKKQLTRILFIFDSSRSMFGKWETGTRMDGAKRVFIKLLDSLSTVDNLQLALRVYGNRSPVPPQDCGDTHLEVPFANNNIAAIKATVMNLKPNGTTPIARSLEECADDFPTDANCKNIIILITDGKEECGGDPCKIAFALRRKGIMLRPFIIGIGLDIETRSAFECMGRFFDAGNETQFEDILKNVVNQAISLTTAQVNLNDTKGNPTETNVNMTFMDQITGKMKHNFIHSLNLLGNPDTLTLDPSITYQILVHTIPPIKIKNIKLISNKHNIISADAPQGFLLLKDEEGTQYKSTQVIVRKNGTMKTLFAQPFYKSEKYITGKYDLEILTLPRLYYNDVVIRQSETTTITIPAPGIATFEMPDLGYGSLYVLSNKTSGEDQIKWIYNLNDTQKESLLLQPGKYMVVFRSKFVTQTTLSISQTFEVKSGLSTYIKL